MTWRGLGTIQFQYATVQEALGAQIWLQTWQQQHYANVRPAGTTSEVVALIPPEPPPPTDPDTPTCNGQLSAVIHLEGPDQATVTGMFLEMTGALGTIQAEGGVFNCYGNSGAGIDEDR